MPSTTAFCTSAKVDLLNARHNLGVGANSFKLALYTTDATHGAATTAYTATNESAVSDGGSGYTATGVVLTNIAPAADGTTAVGDFADPTAWTLAGGTTPALAAESCMIYNDTITTPVADAALSIHSFGSTVTATGIGATFTITMPAAAAGTAIVRIA